ncbi:MAG: rod shape-determining protein MreC [Alloprevotella sp.]|nr:rod shape-determining protein MreC [Bacteroidales bacterium]MDY3942944.1 rod shape-determining protein MreC [Alloprevotella sp.]
MQHLLDFLRKYSHVFLFLFLEVLSLTLLFRYNSYQGSVWFSSVNTAVASIDRWYADALAYLHLGENNAELTQEIVRLQTENELLRKQMQEAQGGTPISDSTMLATLQTYSRIPALVTSNGVGVDNYLVIDRGVLDGIQPEMGVVSGTGIVGIVYLAGPHYSLVMPVTNAKSSISCRIRGQEYFGYLLWDGKNRHEAYVDDIPRYAKVKVGEKIETSGYSAVFPPGLFVGTIRKIENAPDGQSFRLRINLGTDFSRLRHVSVVTTPYKAEIDTLKRTAEQLDSLQTP